MRSQGQHVTLFTVVVGCCWLLLSWLTGEMAIKQVLPCTVSDIKSGACDMRVPKVP
jgi:hypothetical protein